MWFLLANMALVITLANMVLAISLANDTVTGRNTPGSSVAVVRRICGKGPRPAPSPVVSTSYQLVWVLTWTRLLISSHPHSCRSAITAFAHLPYRQVGYWIWDLAVVERYIPIRRHLGGEGAGGPEERGGDAERRPEGAGLMTGLPLGRRATDTLWPRPTTRGSAPGGSGWRAHLIECWPA